MSSVFDIFKVGIGPSSSHTVGPMKAGKAFVDELREKRFLEATAKVEANIYGSLSLTGKGHHTDMAIILGLAGSEPDSVDIDGIPRFIESVRKTGRLPLGSEKHAVDFSGESGIRFHSENLPLHENGMKIRAFDAAGELLYENTYYSIGGGFIVDAAHFGEQSTDAGNIPYPFASAEDILEHCRRTGLSISALTLQNELALRSRTEIDVHFARIWEVMQQAMERGMNTEGILPGGLKVQRRAAPLRHLLEASDPFSSDPMKIVDWVNMFALAVSEENAASGRVVTAPTNGACGVVPAVLMYYNRFVMRLTPELYTRFFMASGVVALLYKMNASISGAEVGCQGEVGVACSMGAAGLAELMGGSPEQVFGASEIAMEHSLGLTCDPIAGLVQVPCIERNAIAAVKAINASRMALRRTSPPRITLDEVIETMYQTGKDMNAKYRETSVGGLARIVHCE